MTVIMYNSMDVLIANTNLNWNAYNHNMGSAKNVYKDGALVIRIFVRKSISIIHIFLKYKKDVYSNSKIIVNYVKKVGI